MAQNTHALPGTEDPGHSHPNEMAYVKIAAILATITLIEVVIYYLESAGSILVPALLVLSAIKFVTVCAYFMHLKFDDRRLTWIFTGGFMLAAAIFIGFCTMHYYHQVTEFASNMIA